jgi:Carboxypeptidase regulatory-like domain
LLCVAMFASCASSPENANKTGRPTATIEGSVRESDSDVPISGVSVFAVRTSDQSQIRTSTDADGHFKLEGFPPGRHLIAVVRSGYVVPGRQEISGYPYTVTEGQEIRDAAVHMIPSGTISGRVLFPDGKPANRVEVQLLQNLYVLGHPQWTTVNRGGSSRDTRVETNERGEFRALGVDPGEYRLRFVPHETTVASVVRGGASTAPLLYPGVRDVSAATAVVVNRGRETLLNDIHLKEERRTWIRISVINESGQPLEGFGEWDAKPAGWIGSEYPLADQRVVNSYHEIQPDAPGIYDITASWPNPSGRLTGTARVEYRGSDVEVRLPIRKAEGRLTGHVMLQETGGTMRPFVGAEVAIGPKISYFARSGPDGALLLPEVYPGNYQLGFVRGLPDDTFVQSVRQGTRDVFTQDLVIEKGESKLEIVVSAGAGVVEGKVTDDGGRPLHNALVALVPESPLKDRRDYYGAYRDTRTDQNGHFEIHGMTPGSYQSYAWIDAPASAYRNEAFLKNFSGMGTTVKVDVGGRVNVVLKALSDRRKHL